MVQLVNPIPPTPSQISEDFEHIHIEDTYDSSINVSYEINEYERDEMDKEIENDIEKQINIPRTDIENVELVLQDLEKGLKKFKVKLKKFFVNCCGYCQLCTREYLKKF